MCYYPLNFFLWSLAMEKETGDIERVRIIGVPMDGDMEKIKGEIVKVITAIK